jgi:hypothetical protein
MKSAMVANDSKWFEEACSEPMTVVPTLQARMQGDQLPI